MIQEHKDLLITDLCGRLPYKVIVEFISYKGEEKPWFGELSCKDLDCFIHDVGFAEIKPYLFPLSSMTEEQKKELSEVIDLEVEIAIEHIKKDIPNYLTGIKRITWLLKNHFDIYDLIPMGLAKDATGKNIY